MYELLQLEGWAQKAMLDLILNVDRYNYTRSDQYRNRVNDYIAWILVSVAQSAGREQYEIDISQLQAQQHQFEEQIATDLSGLLGNSGLQNRMQISPARIVPNQQNADEN